MFEKEARTRDRTTRKISLATKLFKLLKAKSHSGDDLPQRFAVPTRVVSGECDGQVLSMPYYASLLSW